MESPDDLQNLKTKMEFAVEMKTPCCVEKVKKAVNNLKGVSVLNLDLKAQRLMVEGAMPAESLKNAIEEQTGMSTVVVGQGSDQNLGAGVAAISFSDHGVLGLLRLVQSSPSNCVIDGTVDSLPLSQPVYLSLHETGNVSQGCNSCGDLLKFGQQFNGILSRISPNENQRAEFRVNTSDVKLWEMIGRCVVIHQGEKEDVLTGKSSRLACGIVARASGLFQNNKRFCACDGVTIWEQKEAERCCKSKSA